MILRDLPLHEPPLLMSTGVGRHGHMPLEQYLLPDLWCLHLFRDSMDLRVGDEQFDIVPGCATLIPPNHRIQFHFPYPTRHVHLFALFVGRGPTVSAPGFQHLGEDFEAIYAQYEQMIGWFGTQPRRAEARLWDILWRIASPAGEENGLGKLEPLVVRAMEVIELRLGEPLSVAGLAEELGVSHNHLTRRFKAGTGRTVVEFIRERRVRRAEELLKHTTLPIKAVAAQVGLGDFHSFNKAMRRVTGVSPRIRRLVF